jgi:hypothetical protein
MVGLRGVITGPIPQNPLEFNFYSSRANHLYLHFLNTQNALYKNKIYVNHSVNYLFSEKLQILSKICNLKTENIKLKEN